MVIALAAMVPATAFAAKPEIIRGTDVGDDALFADCGDFQLTEDYVADFTEKVFVDRNGNPTQVQLHINYRAVLTHSETGETFADNATINIRIDLATGASH